MRSILFSCLFIVGLMANVQTANANEEASQEIVVSEQKMAQERALDKADKAFRQALFYYFQGEPAQALNQLYQNEQRLGSAKLNARLFEAGLSVHLGLPASAQAILKKIVEQKAAYQQSLKHELEQNTVEPVLAEQPSHTNQFLDTDEQELLLVALLQLSEYAVEHGNNLTAKSYLSQIETVLPQYRDQYHILKQLSAWPKPYVIENTLKLDDNEDHEPQVTLSPYVQFNHAIMALDRGQYEQAYTLLMALNDTPETEAKPNLWQSLFSVSRASEKYVSEVVQQNSDNASDNIAGPYHLSEQRDFDALSDYANLMLAQVYVMQDEYEKSNEVLARFPQDTPFSENALFLFGFTKLKQGDVIAASQLWLLLTEQYPDSYLSWQTPALLAQYYKDLLQYEKAYHQLEQAEISHVSQLESLRAFKFDFSNAKDLRNFARLDRDANASAEGQNDSIEIKLNGELNDDPEVNQQILVLRRHIQKIKQHKQLKISLLANERYQSTSNWLNQALKDPRLLSLYDDLLELGLLKQHIEKQETSVKWLAHNIKLNQGRHQALVAGLDKHKMAQTLSNLTTQASRLSQTINLAQTSDDMFVFASEDEKQWHLQIKQGRDFIGQMSAHIRGQLPEKLRSYQKRYQRLHGALQWQLKEKHIARLWAHKDLLADVYKHIDNLEQQAIRFEQAKQRNFVVGSLIERQAALQNRVLTIGNESDKIANHTSLNIRQKVLLFIRNKETLLNEHLLNTRIGMANLLELIQQKHSRLNSNTNFKNKIQSDVEAIFKADNDGEIGARPVEEKRGQL